MAGTPTSLPRVARSKASRSTSHPVYGRLLGLSANTASRMAQQVQKGFPYSSLEHFHKKSGLPISTIATLVQIPQRTLMRRKSAGRLQSHESERLLRISSIFEKALELFEGDTDAARRWLTTSVPELDRQSPLDFARTEIGAREVEDLIGRLEHGVFT